MASVVLLNQYYSFRKESPEIALATLPINLLYLASYLKQRAIECKIIELGVASPDKAIISGNRFRCGLTDKEIADILRMEQPKVVGIGCMFTRHYRDVLAIADVVKRTDPAIKVVLGGNHASAFPTALLKNPSVDFVVFGEGEVTLHELCNHFLHDNHDYRGIRGLAYKDGNGSAIQNEPRELIKNLDKLHIDYELVDVKKYADVSYTSPFLMRYPSIAITSSRGCPNNCVYCTVKEVYGRTWRGKSARKTVDEIELLYTKYGAGEFAFLDDSASTDKKRWNAICDEIIRRGLDIRWTTPNGIGHWTLDKPTLEKMKRAGCYRVTFGIESGNEETRRYLGKPFSLSQAREMIRHANRIGMWTICTNILGFPYERRQSMMDTVKFAKASGTDFVTFFLLSPHVTSEVYKHFKKEGLLDFDNLFTGEPMNEAEYDQMAQVINEGGVQTKYFSPEGLKMIQMQAYRSFIFHRSISYLINPVHLARKVRSFEDLRYMLRLIFVGLGIFMRTFRHRTTRDLFYAELDVDSSEAAT